jgi:hypothetical protein
VLYQYLHKSQKSVLDSIPNNTRLEHWFKTLHPIFHWVMLFFIQLKCPSFADTTERADRGWKEAQRQGYFTHNSNILRIYDKSYGITKVSTINQANLDIDINVVDIVISFKLTLNQSNQHHRCHVNHNTNVTSHHPSLGSSAFRPKSFWRFTLIDMWCSCVDLLYQFFVFFI